MLLHWARRLEAQESDAADLVQDVLAILVKEMPRFQYRADQRFRGWLWTVTLNRSRERGRRRNGLPVSLTDSALEEATCPEERPAFDEDEYRQYIVSRALQLMQVDFQPDTWKACWEYVVRDRPAAEVAGELGISVNAVHLAKSRVLRRLRSELSGLLD